VKTLHANRLTR